MPSFKYEVQDSSGQVLQGVVEAQDLSDAANQARSRGYLLNVQPAASGAMGVLQKLQSVSVDFGPGLKDVLAFTNQLAVMIKAGINIRSAVGAIGEQTDNPKFARIIMQIKADVESGEPFSEALAKYPKVFPPLYVNMVKASELSGNFSHMLERIAEYLEQQLETRSMVRGAMIYPVIIAVMAVVTTIFLLTFVLPKFTALFAGKEHLLPTPTVILMNISDFLRTKWYIVIGGIIGFIVGLYYAIQTPTGREYWDRFKLKVPLLGKMFRALYISRSLQTMGELVNAGVPMLETLKITSDISGNTLYRRLWDRVHTSVEEGQKIARPLAQQQLLPPNVVQMVSAGEESGKLGEVLRDVAEYYTRQLKDTIKTVTAMIEPIMIILMGVVVGFIAMSIILPVFKMSNLVK